MNKKPDPKKNRTQRLLKIQSAVLNIEDQLLELRKLKAPLELEENNSAFSSLYYIRNLARKAP